MTGLARTPVDAWVELRACALVGTARRPVPAPLALAGVTLDRPDRTDGGEGTSAAALLDAAALAGIGRRAGRRATTGIDVPPPAPADDRPAAPTTAGHLLELLLGPLPPAAVHRIELVAHWASTCAASGRRVPAALLVPLLDQATTASSLRAPVARCLGERGRWLAGLNATWSWADGPLAAPSGGGAGTVLDPDDWARLPAAARVATLADRRAVDPAAARELVRHTWRSDAAGARAAHLAVLADGLGPDDEELLEAALDDRAASVRQQAATLLDALPASDRAARMADRLIPLLTIEGKRRHRTVSVALPDDPDAAGVRDGLGPPPAGRSARGWWVEHLAAGAPLSVWTDLTGEDEATTWELVADADARSGIRRAVVARRDHRWAAAIFASVPDPRLLAAIEPGDRAGLVGAQLWSTQRPNSVGVGALVAHVPAPWPLDLSQRVIEVIRADPRPVAAVNQIGSSLATGLHPDSQAILERWIAELVEEPQLAAALRTLVQFQSLHRSITEAFS